MSFHEKSAWIMSLALLLGGVFYFGIVLSASSDGNQLVQPTLPLVAVYTVLLIILAILGHVAIAVFSPKEANAPLDERERGIFVRAGHISGYIFGVGVVLSLGLYLLSYGGDILFYAIFASLMISQFAEYAIRIVLYRVAL